ncbi:DEAD/DEAH box helicase [Candidatus Parcubacteria bacterium]|nr:MAG: DEAD/DEAH box helicase [Candidatus Parcubacteria bacterium]
MAFNELNTIESYLIYRISGVKIDTSESTETVELSSVYGDYLWKYRAANDLKRDPEDVLAELELREALVKINPDITKRPELAEEVLYKLKTILLSVDSVGLVKANEEFSKWLTGEKTMPFGENNQHVPIYLIDFENINNNSFIVTNQYTVIGKTEKRPDIVFLVNGIPIVVGELKTPVRPAISWLDGAVDIHDDYENTIPQLFVPNLFSFATEGKTYRYGSVRMPLELWGPWKTEEVKRKHTELKEIDAAIKDQFRPEVLLDLIQNFTLYATDKKNRRIKVISRYQQYEGANKIVDRVKEGKTKQGLIWHFQGSGKSYLIVFAAQKLRKDPELKSPTVLVVIDRQDLDSQMSNNFSVTEIPNVVPADSIKDLMEKLKQDTRKIIITMMHKFREVDGPLNERENIIVLVDEAHRTQEGDLGRKMRSAIPNAFLFGLTGTPINKADRNTFYAFGSPEDSGGYMSLYSFQESVDDGATLKLHFEPRLLDIHFDKVGVDKSFIELTQHLSDKERKQLIDHAAKMSAFLKSPKRVSMIAQDIASHYKLKVEPQGLKAMIVTPDRYACDIYKKELDKLFPEDASAVVISTSASDELEFRRKYELSKDQEERLLETYRDPSSSLKFLIVTAKLLTGFDAPILQCMYLDKSMKDHGLLQAICRTNRVYKDKSHGLIVDYYGVFDDVAKSLEFDDERVKSIVTNISELRMILPEATDKCLKHFPGVDRGIEGFEGLQLAQDCVNTDKKKDSFAADYVFLSKIWESVSPDPVLNRYEKDYRWLSQVYQSIKPASDDTGRLLWHALGAQTTKLMHDHMKVGVVNDDLDKIILDSNMIETLTEGNTDEKGKEIEKELIRRLKKHKNNPQFVALSERLEKLRDQAMKGLINSVDFLKQLVSLARDVVVAEKDVQTEDERKNAKTALTELFLESKTDATPAIVEKIVNDIDEIVKIVRFPGWQTTNAGEREVQKALRKTLLRYKLHKEAELFNKSYEYIKEYY